MSAQKDDALSDELGILMVATGIPLEKTISRRRLAIGEADEAAQKLIHLRSVLEENGITDLSGLGNLRIGGKGVHVIPTPGILRPASTNSKDLLGRLVSVAGVTVVETTGSGSKSNLTPRRTFVITNELKMKPLARAVVPRDSVLPISVAYWVATEIEIADNTRVVFTTKCKNLYIVAESIKIGNNVQFTWEQPAYGQSIVPIPVPRQPRQRRRPDSESQIIHGTEQIHGRAGNKGVDGTDAPAVEVWTLVLTGRPVVAFAGTRRMTIAIIAVRHASLAATDPLCRLSAQHKNHAHWPTVLWRER